jgi:hypothetical protein
VGELRAGGVGSMVKKFSRMNLPPHYLTGCEQLVQNTQQSINEKRFYRDEYNKAIMCIVNNRYLTHFVA